MLQVTFPSVVKVFGITTKGAGIDGGYSANFTLFHKIKIGYPWRPVMSDDMQALKVSIAVIV